MSDERPTMFQNRTLLAACIGLAAGGLVTAGPLRAAPASDLVEYFATEAACKDAGALRKQYQQWQGFTCRKGEDPAGTGTAYFLIPAHAATPAPTPATPTTKPAVPGGGESIGDIISDHAKPMIADGTKFFCKLVFDGPCR
ncbi:hypothetical protein ACTI_81770 [Actinoplanes sp. OR16]|uniref:hypothetical protein n=1 Tax=Actinoplanes sp. OR16 TaxID=946334 RepID=UPI000F709CF8|nr:hypothetical protein [Actinoplanes sp. OR16]BBH71492.1 hypothetical protein ACTI_81770 [Actinoplanes sp. OR16]